MNYHSIFYDDMKNGTGLRVTLFISGCEHNCPGCQNPMTHDINSGEKFDQNVMNRIREHLNHDYIDGITLTGGDPLHPSNRPDVLIFLEAIKREFPTKTIWLYTGYTYEELKRNGDYFIYEILRLVDVLVDGRFEIDKLDANYPWAGSTNQRVINMKETLKAHKNIILYKEDDVESKTNKILFGE